MTWGELITQALMELGVITSGAQPTAEQVSRARDMLRQMLESWSLIGLMVPSVSYWTREIGPGEEKTAWSVRQSGLSDADVAAGEITELLEVSYRGPSDTEYEPMREVSRSEMTLRSSSLDIDPTLFFFENSHPISMLYFDARVREGGAFRIRARGEINAGRFLENDQIDLPPGYERAIRTNLALELAAQYGYKGQDLAPTLLAAARESKMAIMKRNIEPVAAPIDAAFLDNDLNALY